MQILILGGTAWLGREIAREALARGHAVTALARGESGAVPDAATLVVADRAHPDAYAAVADRDWDAVVEISWQPAFVREALSALAGRAAHWTLISSTSVYASAADVGADESAATFSPFVGERAEKSEYGEAKAAVEQASRAALDDEAAHRAPGVAIRAAALRAFVGWPRRIAAALNDSPDKPMLNRPLRGAYPPGSTIKPFLALAALTSGKRTPQQSIFDPGFYQLPGSSYRFRDDKPGGHGSVDMYKSIVVSCDTYYYTLAGETDIDDTARFLAQLGFGHETGVDIEGELTGTLPSREWKRTRFAGKNYRDEHRKWYLGDSISAGIGQGYNAFTPMQQAQAIATIANNGVAFVPHLVKSVINLKTGEERAIAAQPSHTISAKPESIAVIRNALVGVNKEGTGATAFAGAKYVSAGKTGTAQVYSLKGEKYSASKVDERLRDHAWFVAYAPADQPRIALSVLVENGGFGAQAAAPVARKVFDYFLLGTAEKGPAPIPAAKESEDESD